MWGKNIDFNKTWRGPNVLDAPEEDGEWEHPRKCTRKNEPTAIMHAKRASAYPFFVDKVKL